MAGFCRDGHILLGKIYVQLVILFSVFFCITVHSLLHGYFNENFELAKQNIRN